MVAPSPEHHYFHVRGVISAHNLSEDIPLFFQYPKPHVAFGGQHGSSFL